MDDVDRERGRLLALALGGAAVLLGIASLVLDFVRGDGFSTGPLVVLAVGLMVIASVRRRGRRQP